MVMILGLLASCDTQLPLYSYRVPAGFPSPAADHVEQKISLDELLDLRAPHMYLVRIEGDSMTGAGIFCGDIAIVNRALEAEPGRTDALRIALGRDRFRKRLGFAVSTSYRQLELPVEYRRSGARVCGGSISAHKL